MRQIDSIIIHCADTPDEKSFGAEDIERWHKERAKTEPWSYYVDHQGEVRYIGYHYVVRKDGVIEAARPESEIGCHCKGMNKGSLGVCWIGSKAMTSQQKSSLVVLVAELCVMHGLNTMDVYGHNQFSPKTCPNFNSRFTFESMDEFRTLVEMSMRQIK